MSQVPQELSRQLSDRQMSMIALGGSIGTGIFLASGYVIHTGGLGGAILAYLIISLMVYFIATSLGEMATHMPTTGSFCEYAGKFVNKPFGVAMSYNFWLNWTITIAAEVSAAAIVLKYWFPEASLFGLSCCIFAAIFIINLFSVKMYGEIEYWLSFLKVAAIAFFIIVGCILIYHEPQFGINNAVVDGSPFHDGFSGFFLVFLFAGFSFQGIEILGVTAGESASPEKSIPKAMRVILWRLVLFYLLTTLVIGLLIPSTDKSLSVQDNVAISPFTLIFSHYFEGNANIIVNVMNAVIFLALLSAANSSLYASSRSLWYMGTQKIAHRTFSRIHANGVPFNAFVVTFVVAIIMFLFAAIGSGGLFKTLVIVSSLCGFITWFGIVVSHYYFRRQLSAETLKQLRFKAKGFPFSIYFSLFTIVCIVVGQIYLSIHETFYSIFLHSAALVLFVSIMLISWLASLWYR